MRMTAARLSERLRRDDSGAVLMIVAVTLFVLIGMLVLTVDLGRAVAVKREMVTGTDAAALAAAQQCAFGNSTDDAQAAAEAVLAKNKASATLTTFEAPGCGSPPEEAHIVTVESTVDVEYYFAGIFGFDSGDVVARAVAQWGVVEQALAVPITVDYDQLSGCGIVPDDPPDEVFDCNLDYPKERLQEPRWGVLDIEQWGDEETDSCSVPASELSDMIDNGGSFEPLPAPALTCVDNGLSNSVWEELEFEPPRSYLFPVMDLDRSTGFVKPERPPLGGEACLGEDIESLRAANYDCEITHAYIVGWIELLVTNVTKDGADIGVAVTYQGFTTGGGIPGDGTPDFGARAVRLVE